MTAQLDDRFPQQAQQRDEPLLPILALPTRFVADGFFGCFLRLAVGAENQQCVPKVLESNLFYSDYFRGSRLIRARLV